MVSSPNQILIKEFASKMGVGAWKVQKKRREIPADFNGLLPPGRSCGLDEQNKFQPDSCPGVPALCGNAVLPLLGSRRIPRGKIWNPLS
jgi:hypothetical protein